MFFPSKSLTRASLYRLLYFLSRSLLGASFIIIDNIRSSLLGFLWHVSSIFLCRSLHFCRSLRLGILHQLVNVGLRASPSYPHHQYLSRMQHRSPAFSRRRSEHTVRNQQLKPTVLVRNHPNSFGYYHHLVLPQTFTISYFHMQSFKVSLLTKLSKAFFGRPGQL